MLVSFMDPNMLELLNRSGSFFGMRHTFQAKGSLITDTDV